MKLAYRFFLIFLWPILVLATNPTEEGLFRNGENPDIGSDLLIYKIQIKSQRNVTVLSTEQEENTTTDQVAPSENTSNTTAQTTGEKTLPALEAQVEIVEQTNYIRTIVFNNNESNPQYLFLFYDAPTYANSSLKKIIPIMSQRNILSTQYDETSHILIGLLQMFTMNQSEILVNFLKNIEPNFKTNKEALNQQKVALYKKYHDYLKIIKENPDLKDDESLENPRAPKDEEKMKLVQEIEAQPMYTPSAAVSLKRDENGFFWSLTHNNVQAQFDHGTLFLKQLHIKSVHNYNVDVEKFILYTNKFQLPPSFIIDVEGKEKVTVKFDSFTTYPNSKVQIAERIDYYSQMIEKNERAKLESEQNKDSVVLINGEAKQPEKEKPFVNLLYRLK